MKFKQHYSGSSGNLYTVTAANGQRVIIDVGLTWKKVLKALDYDLSGIQGVFPDHAHLDHSKSTFDALESGLDVYANESTLVKHEALNHYNAHLIKGGDKIELDDFKVLCFDVNHDVPCVGFVIQEIVTKETMLFATDTAFLKQKFEIPFDIVAIECSYEKDWLQKRVDSGDIHEAVAKRLLMSHFEKSNCMKYLKEKVDLSRCRELHLLHLSGDNIDHERTRREFEEEFFIETIICDDRPGL